MSKLRIVIFAKAPLPGRAKTRLMTALGLQGSAQLAKNMLQSTLANALEADIGPVELCITDSDHAVWGELEIPQGICWSEQGAGDLGDRMARRSQQLIAKGERVLLIGTDCPQLDSKQLRQAAQALTDFDSCLVPASDGGYVLLGLKQYLPAVFKAMPWSTAQLAELTRQAIEATGSSVKLFEALHDIDEPGDLVWLPEYLKPELNEYT